MLKILQKLLSKSIGKDLKRFAGLYNSLINYKLCGIDAWDITILYKSYTQILNNTKQEATLLDKVIVITDKGLAR